MVKSIRLCANLWTSEDIAKREIKNFNPQNLELLCNILAIEPNEKNEDLILNALSCLSNILFFQTEIPNTIVVFLVSICKTFIRESGNEEVRIESLRIYGNISRNKAYIQLFATAEIIKILYEVLSNKQTKAREKYYSIGVLMNCSTDEKLRDSFMYTNTLDLILDKLQESDFEDLEMSKVICKLLTNLCDTKSVNKWTNLQLSRLDGILTGIADECDSNLDVANNTEKDILNDLHKVVNNLINVLPEVTNCCPVADCGRKFITVQELEQHIQRRHKK